MKSLLIAIAFLLIRPLMAEDHILVYSFGKMKVAFISIDGLVVNRSCQEKGCMALSKGKEFKDAELPAESLVGGKNPKAVRCKELMGGTVLIGQDRKGNAQSFCHFKDDSFLR